MEYKVHVAKSLEKDIVDQTPFGCGIFGFLNGAPYLQLWKKEWDGPREIRLTYARALDAVRREAEGKKFKPFDFIFEVA